LPVSFPRTDILTGGVWGLVAPASVNLVTPTHFFYAAPRIADPDPVSAVLTPSLVFREIPEQRKRRREPDGEIADEKESAAFHLISVATAWPLHFKESGAGVSPGRKRVTTPCRAGPWWHGCLGGQPPPSKGYRGFE